MKECIAAGEVLLEKDGGEVVKSITAAVYAEVAGNSEESNAADSKKLVVLKYRNFNCDEDVAAPFGFEEIADGKTLKVPGVNDNEDVTLSAPVVVKYSKTKAFESNGKTVVYASLRYEM